MNTLKVGLMLVALTALFLLIGNLIGGTTGVAIAFGLAVVLNVGSFWFSDKLVLKMTGAQPVDPTQAPELHAVVDRLAARAGIPKPRLYVVDDPSPNAFATGRSPEHGVVAVNTGLLRVLDQPEVEGVIAHELAHIRHRDTLTMAVVATVAGAVMMLASFARFAAFFGGNDEEGGNPVALLVMALVAPLAAMMIQMGISRAREYEADRLGAEIAGSPNGLANALLKLERGAEAIPAHTPVQAAHLCIVNPLRGGGLASLFSTHPPVAERVRRLQAMQG
ncbi:MAG: zinc metalloprotease HtpX [Chthonomonadaceae bacterium]|nr:zinc metalloprotease HtpX [Chthonomonadaceae bacterium]